ncbi:hypothetical protein QOZ80_8AG0628280 [Eleusine coracana subsp. coracana]|nr:hypothetical protein QOZ80_8AG0628280 [Eleusine coracana subsp. coracana]
MGGDYLPLYGDPDNHVYCVTSEVGTAFALGGAGGAAFHFARGLVRGSPGSGQRLAAGVHAACANAPRVAGVFGAFCAVFSTLESAVYFADGRQYTISGDVAATTATFALQGMLRGGVPAAARWAFLGSTIMLAVYEYGLTLRVRQSEESIATMVRRNGDQPMPAALLPKPDSSLSKDQMTADLLYGTKGEPSNMAR